MKKLLIILLILLSTISLAGIDEMRDREAGMSPQYNNGNGNGNGNGGGNGNNPNVPIDDLMLPFLIIVAAYAVYKMKNRK